MDPPSGPTTDVSATDGAPPKKPNIILCGTARNCERYLDAVFANIKDLATLFADIRIVVAYDASSDKTLYQLVRQKSEWRDKMEILVGQEPLTHQRTVNIARARNRLMQHMRSAFDVAEWPYFIMMDLDDVCAGKLQLAPLARVLSESDQWDTCSFNRAGYYDIWALSVKPYIYSCWGFHDPLTVVHTMQDYIIDLLRETPDHRYLEVLSAFNGFAIYKSAIFFQCHYDWRMPKKYMSLADLQANQQILGFRATFSPLDQQTNEPDCEHRHFHMQAKYDFGARIMICPEHIF
jgi:glycosyltransferase involved in cell wall biosynthesis